MRVRYTALLLLVAVVGWGLQPAFGQSVSYGFEADEPCAGGTGSNDTSCESGVPGEDDFTIFGATWSGSGTSSVGTVGQCDAGTQCYVVALSESATAVLASSEADNVIVFAQRAGTNGTATITSFATTDCTGPPVAAANPTTTGADYALGNGVRCIAMSSGGNRLAIDNVRYDQTVLAVELADFSATASGDAVTLAWASASETNHAGFAVERLTASGPVEMGWVDARGAGSSYAYTLRGLAPGTHRFQLRFVELDGSTSLSRAVEATVDLPGSYALTDAYPNPFNPQTQLELTVDAAQDVRVEAYNLLGRRVAELFSGHVEANQTRSVTFEAGALPSGIYVIRVVGERFTATRQVTLLK